MDEPHVQVCDLYCITLREIGWVTCKKKKKNLEQGCGADSRDFPESWRQKQENITTCQRCHVQRKLKEKKGKGTQTKTKGRKDGKDLILSVIL